jgi:hypothetical protein
MAEKDKKKKMTIEEYEAYIDKIFRSRGITPESEVEKRQRLLELEDMKKKAEEGVKEWKPSKAEKIKLTLERITKPSNNQGHKGQPLREKNPRAAKWAERVAKAREKEEMQKRFVKGGK